MAVLEFVQTERDLRAWFSYLKWRVQPLRSMACLFLYALLGIIGILGLSEGPISSRVLIASPSRLAALLAAILGIEMFVLALLVPNIMARRCGRMARQLGPRRLDWTENGLVQSVAGVVTSVPWSAVEDVATTRTHTFVILAKGPCTAHAFLIPHRAFQDHEAALAFGAKVRTRAEGAKGPGEKGQGTHP